MASLEMPDWPDAVLPPGTGDWEASAAAWLLDVLPAGYRGHEGLHRYPVALAALARHYADGCVESSRAGYRVVRNELSEKIPPHAVDIVLSAYRVEGRQLAAAARAVRLVERALRGETIIPLSESALGTSRNLRRPAETFRLRLPPPDGPGCIQSCGRG
jgi:hypothetical protein